MDTEERGRRLNWRQACALIGCSRSHFYNLVNSGVLPALRLGKIKGLRVYEADCLADIRGQGSHIQTLR